MSPSSESDKTNQVAIGELYSAVVTMQIAPCETVFSPAIYSLRCYFYTTTITWNHQNGWNEFLLNQTGREFTFVDIRVTSVSLLNFLFKCICHDIHLWIWTARNTTNRKIEIDVLFNVLNLLILKFSEKMTTWKMKIKHHHHYSKPPKGWNESNQFIWEEFLTQTSQELWIVMNQSSKIR